MAEYNAERSTTTDFTGSVKNFNVGVQHLDVPDTGAKETFYDFPEADEHVTYYKTIPEIYSAINSYANYVVGKGIVVESNRTKIILDKIKGCGNDSFKKIIWNLFVGSMVTGDSFAEIIRDDEGRLINLKPLSTSDMRVVYNKKNLIERYDYRKSDGDGGYTKLRKEDVFHLTNDRVFNEIHGTSRVEACRWIIDAIREALEDKRLIEHRDKALGIVYYDTDDAGEISYTNTQIEKAVKKGEMLGLPKDTATIEEFPNKATGDKLQWIQELREEFYEVIGIPKAIVNPASHTEASSKMGYFVFEPHYTAKQTDLEDQIWNQLAIRVKFKRPRSLGGIMQEDEEKNTGQMSIQPNETEVGLGRTE